ncbi:MAG: O-antigen ligase family protein [Rubritalea sp.]
MVCIVGNPGLLLFGSVVRYGCMAFGLAILLWICVRQLQRNAEAVNEVGMVVAGALFMEGFQWMRNQQMFEFTQIVFRGILYIAFLTALLAGKYSSRKLLKRPVSDVWKVMTLLVAGLSSAYIVLSIRSPLAAEGGRMVADESLNPVGVATVYSSLAIVAVILSLYHNKWLWRGMAYFALAASLFAVLKTGSRGGLLFAVLTMCGVLACRMRGKDVLMKKQILWFIGLAALGGVAAAAYMVDDLDFILKRFSSLSDGGDMSTEARTDSYGFYLSRVNRWWLAGLEYYSGPYPHNFFLELCIRFGAIGFVLSILIIRYAFKTAGALWNYPQPIVILVGAMFLFNLLASMTSMSIEMHRWMAWGLGGMLGVFAGKLKKQGMHR